MQIHRLSSKLLTAHFKEYEFFTHSPDFSENSHYLDSKLVYAAQIIRDFIKSPVIITSSYRTPLYNAVCGGSENSYHLKSMALDLDCGSMQSLVNENIIRRGPLYVSLRNCGINGFGLAENFIHIDTRLSGYSQDSLFGSFSLWYY